MEYLDEEIWFFSNQIGVLALLIKEKVGIKVGRKWIIIDISKKEIMIEIRNEEIRIGIMTGMKPYMIWPRVKSQDILT